jgi:hypothetical protein
MSTAAAFTFAVVCEASADLRLSSGLADRVLCQEIDWLDSESLDLYRRWRGLEESGSHLEWHWVPKLARELNVKAHGHFGGEPGALDAAMARKALLLLTMTRQVPDAVILVRDTDGQAERRRGLAQARDTSPWPFQVILAILHAKRECWVLAGFEPRSEAEERALADLKRELGFDPRLEAENLTAAQPQAQRNAKRVLDRLVGGNEDREEACWRSCDVEVLGQRGRLTGLADYIEEIRSRLVPLFTSRIPGARP